MFLFNLTYVKPLEVSGSEKRRKSIRQPPNSRPQGRVKVPLTGEKTPPSEGPVKFSPLTGGKSKSPHAMGKSQISPLTNAKDTI